MKDDGNEEKDNCPPVGDKTLAWSKAYDADRLVLMDCLPLEVPLCVSIEPSNVCNFRCQMCWQSTKEYHEQGGPFQNMSMEVFEKVLADLQAMCRAHGRKIKLVKFYSSGEGMLHPQIGEMIQRCREADVAEKMELTSNCSLLTEKIASELIAAELDYLRVSIYSVEPAHHDYVTGQRRFGPEEIRSNVARLYEMRERLGKKKPFICAKIMDMHDEENERFKEVYRGISDEQVIDVPWNIAGLEENSLDKLYGADGEKAHEEYLDTSLYKKRKACRYPFTHLTVRSNGDVVVCCSDWPRQTMLGSVLEESLDDIWHGKRLYDFRVMQLRTHGSRHPLCKDCEIPLRDKPEDDIDAFPVEKLSYKEKEQ